MKAGVAAGHPATAEVGFEILAEGGTAADAVVAMALASCVAETVMSGLLAGCHVIAFDGSKVQNLDGFAAVPSGRGRPRRASDRLRRGDRRLLDRPRLVRRPGPSGGARNALGGARPPPLAPARGAGSSSRAGGRAAPRDARPLARDAARPLFARARRRALRPHRRDARGRGRPVAARARRRSRRPCGRGRRERLPRVDRGGASPHRRRRPHRRRPARLSRALARSGSRALERTARRDARRPLRRP